LNELKLQNHYSAADSNWQRYSLQLAVLVEESVNVALDVAIEG
jgi:hypothetical protein